MTDIKALKEELGRRNLVCVLNHGHPELSADRANPTLLYISAENFISKLDEEGKEITQDLQIKMKKEHPQAPPIAPPVVPPIATAAVTAKVAETKPAPAKAAPKPKTKKVTKKK